MSTNSWLIRKPAQWDALFLFLKGIKIPECGIEIRWGAPTRTNNQNEYYWKVVTPMVSDYLTEKHGFPYTKDMAHDLLKSEFLPTHTDPITGRVFYGSTTTLRRSGDGEDTWQAFIQKIQRWASLGGLYLPDPGEAPRE